MVKKSLVSELPGPSSQTFWLCKVNDGDALGWVALTDGKREILLATALGMAIRFNEDEVRPMGLVAAGVNAVKLGVGDEVVGTEVVSGLGSGKTAGTDARATEIFLIGSDGKAKRVALADFPSQGRYGRGVIAWDLPLGTKLAGIATGKPNSMVTIHLLKAAAKSARLDEAGLKKRAATRGDVVVEVKPGDAVVGLTAAWSVERFLGGAKSQANKHEPTVDSGKPEQLSLLGAVKEKKTVRKKAADSPVAKKPAASKPSAAKTPAKSTPASKTPAKKTPVQSPPAPQTPARKTPAAGKSTTKK